MDINNGHKGEFPLSGMTLLLAEDEHRLRQILHLMAKELGAQVIAVDSCEKAVDIYKENQDTIDVVFLDLRMHGMSGEAAYAELRKFDPSARVVLSSGIPPERSFIDSLRENGCDFLEKPFDIDQLSDVISRVAATAH